ncbi:unnamed protein product [Musa acuminata subsp. malaccensis]|uniref:non-specific serine/threonine protein kinase n=1 Tax=Musa acuminata subsp. malaccensis TaxID=214687 RepID=A0A804J869_MUSAM|nr:PREDICTED: serine/threonine-protein kinase UCN-like [Musa acuminata subsp. malaccensis]CAG1839494.1 unnamed protein product [Musa acuminata subsp. malaccensis]
MAIMELDLDRLRAVRVIGRGAMGTVFLVTSRCSGATTTDPQPCLPPLFALKVVEKHSPSAKPDSDRRARWELNLLSRLSSAGGDGQRSQSHPFLPSLLGSVETPELLAWAVPFCSGGDLHALRHSLSPDAAFSPTAIRFYLSELVAALAHLHSLRIAYRDLKPENVLLQSSGHITLTDFDLSRHLSTSASPSASSTAPPHPLPPENRPRRRHRRQLTRIFAFGAASAYAEADHHRHHLKKARSARVSPVSRRRISFSTSGTAGGGERSFSFVGTEEYVSPEVVRGEGHGFAVDWWALGVLAYEMAYGRTPFKGRNRKETFRNVLTRPPEFPGGRRCDLTDLIERLLAKDPARRLGSAAGADEVRAHPFFRGVRWEILAKVTRPPFLPPPEEDLEAAVIGLGEDGGFDVRDYFNGLRQPASQPSPSMGSLTEF